MPRYQQLKGNMNPFNNNYPWYVIFELSFLKDINVDSILDKILENSFEKNYIFSYCYYSILHNLLLFNKRLWSL